MGAFFSKMWTVYTKSISVLLFMCLAYLAPRLKRYIRRIRLKYVRKYEPKIIIIGAGFSGICCAIKLKKELGYNNFIILERHKEVGGTWYTNTYPGCECDIPSYLYSYSFEQKHDWSKMYAPQAEILQYIKNVVNKYDILSHIQFNSNVNSLKYDETKCEWTVNINEFDNNMYSDSCTRQLKCNIVISCQGGLTSTNIKYPYPMEMLSKYKGVYMHSGHWDTSYSWQNKTIAVIGSGASALQILPILQKQAKKLYAFQRSPTYVFPKVDKKISPKIHTLYYYLPVFMYLRRFMIYSLLETLVYPLLLKKNKVFQQHAIKLWQKHRDNPKYGIPSGSKYDFIRDAVTPKGYTPGCKRMSMKNDWYPALTASNTEFIVNRKDSTNCIIDFYEKGVILADGRKIELDAIAFCTGYNVSDISKFKSGDVYGINNETVCGKWSKSYGPYCYKGVFVSDFPNFFLCLGPGSGVGSNSFLTSIEIGCDYIVKCIEDMMINDYKSIEIKKSVENEYNTKMDKRMKDMIWTQSERSWYKLQNGRVHALFGYSMATWWWYLRKPVWNEFNIVK